MRNHTLVLKEIAVIFQVISVLPFSAFGINPDLVKKCCVLFSNYFVFASCRALNLETNGSPQPLVYFLPYEREQEVQKCIHPKHFQVSLSGIKISNVVTKETSQIVLQTLWHELPCQQSLLPDLSRKIGDAGYCSIYGTKGQINLVSL